ncbi:unnamed protein product [Ceutorhynchus assimilis]|uniref:Uncharacterized protein n=1 Tax=Ceutorhynchus assimilis TaxID=467358 RepID=A0A9N9MNE1_9CUCU|nr:unnamed protein product [Ceutorhynchus assimilis]
MFEMVLVIVSIKFQSVTVFRNVFFQFFSIIFALRVVFNTLRRQVRGFPLEGMFEMVLVIVSIKFQSVTVFRNVFFQFFSIIFALRVVFNTLRRQVRGFPLEGMFEMVPVIVSIKFQSVTVFRNVFFQFFSIIFALRVVFNTLRRQVRGFPLEGMFEMVLVIVPIKFQSVTVFQNVFFQFFSIIFALRVVFNTLRRQVRGFPLEGMFEMVLVIVSIKFQSVTVFRNVFFQFFSIIFALRVVFNTLRRQVRGFPLEGMFEMVPVIVSIKFQSVTVFRNVFFQFFSIIFALRVVFNTLRRQVRGFPLEGMFEMVLVIVSIKFQSVTVFRNVFFQFFSIIFALRVVFNTLRRQVRGFPLEGMFEMVLVIVSIKFQSVTVFRNVFFQFFSIIFAIRVVFNTLRRQVRGFPLEGMFEMVLVIVSIKFQSVTVFRNVFFQFFSIIFALRVVFNTLRRQVRGFPLEGMFEMVLVIVTFKFQSVTVSRNVFFQFFSIIFVLRVVFNTLRRQVRGFPLEGMFEMVLVIVSIKFQSVTVFRNVFFQFFSIFFVLRVVFDTLRRQVRGCPLVEMLEMVLMIVPLGLMVLYFSEMCFSNYFNNKG